MGYAVLRLRGFCRWHHANSLLSSTPASSDESLRAGWHKLKARLASVARHVDGLRYQAAIAPGQLPSNRRTVDFSCDFFAGKVFGLTRKKLKDILSFRSPQPWGFECDGRFEAQCWVPPAWIKKAIDAMTKGQSGLGTCLMARSPDEFCVDGFEDGLDHSVLIAVTLAAHGRCETPGLQKPAVVVRAVLAALVRVNESGGRLPQEDSLVQSFEGHVLLLPVTRRSADNAP